MHEYRVYVKVEGKWQHVTVNADTELNARDICRRQFGAGSVGGVTKIR